MTIKSTAFENNGPIQKTFTCEGENSNPPLLIGGIPQEAKSMVLIVQDTDATPLPWIHWFVFNIPVTETKVEENTTPEGGTEGLANGGKPGYEGPCPKYFTGTHHYEFIIFALDTTLPFSAKNTFDEVYPFLKDHILDSAKLVGTAEGKK